MAEQHRKRGEGRGRMEMERGRKGEKEGEGQETHNPNGHMPNYLKTSPYAPLLYSSIIFQ